MFERRLKFFLGILLGVMSLLLLRAVHLQVITRSDWRKEAEEFNKRPAYIETTRGRILDHSGVEIAIDDACMDACVDYRAVSRNEKWINDLAAARLVDRLGDGYRKAPRKRRIEMVAEEAAAVNADIERMWELLAKESNQTVDQIEEICHTIDLKVAMRTRWLQYRKFQAADKARDLRGTSPWYRRWLIEGGDGGPSVDDFEQLSGEQVDVHPILKNISTQTYMRLAKESGRCPGLSLRPGTVRRYPAGRAGAHLLGSLGAVTRQDLLDDPNLDDELRKYDFTDLIGRGGLEALAEPTLRGTRGKVFRQAGRDDEVVSKPIAGGDLKCTIDIELQAALQQMFARMKVPSNIKDDPRTFEVAMHGAAVVIDVKSGHVRALASYPDYDANELSANYEKLAKQIDDAPLMNRATQSRLEPGSTIKPVVGLAAITQGVPVSGVGPMTIRSGIECTGYLVLNGHKMPNGRCWVATKYAKARNGDVAHHPIPTPHKGTFGNRDGFLCYTEALERSCNVYFETLADSLSVAGLSYWFDRFGLGRETGIGIPEACGLLPSGLRMHSPSLAWFSGIGQSGVLATPIQMANVAATIARDGLWIRPRLVEDSNVSLAPVRTRDGGVVPDQVELGLSKEAVAACREGMTRVVNGEAGTGDRAHMKEVLVAGKTGTAEAARLMDPAIDDDGKPVLDKDGKPVAHPRIPATADHPTATPWYRGWGDDGTQFNHAWFIGFAPAKDPQVAFAVMIQYGGSGNFAARQATTIVEKCIEHGYVRK